MYFTLKRLQLIEGQLLSNCTRVKEGVAALYKSYPEDLKDMYDAVNKVYLTLQNKPLHSPTNKIEYLEQIANELNAIISALEEFTDSIAKLSRFAAIELVS